MTGSKAAPAPYHHGDLRRALVAEARRTVEAGGVEALSLRGVAAAAGVSRAAPYHHFRDKSALLAAVAADGFRDFTAEMLKAAGDGDDPRVRLNGLGLGYVRFAVAHPALFQMMQGPALRDVEDAELEAARQASAAPLVDCVAACMPGAPEGEVRAACAAAWSLVHGMAVLWIDGKLTRMLDHDDLEAAALSITRTLGL